MGDTEDKGKKRLSESLPLSGSALFLSSPQNSNEKKQHKNPLPHKTKQSSPTYNPITGRVTLVTKKNLCLLLCLSTCPE